MDDKKRPENGSYTQIPNVFFDTCDLPETAQVLYLRLYRHIAYKDDHKFVGSIRKLSTLVRLSKSTVERMSKKLEESRLISIGYESSQEQDRNVMTITINPQELWILNKQHYEEGTVPIWDKVMPDTKTPSQIGTNCPEMGHDDFNLGQHSVNLGQTVPDTSSKSAQESINTINNSNTEERKNADVSAHPEATHSFTHSSPSPQKSSFSSPMQEKPEEVIFTEEEQTIYDYACQTLFKATAPTKTAKLKSECAELAKHVKTLEQFQSLVQFVRTVPYIKGQIHLKNLVNELNGWLQSQQASSQNPTLTPYVIDQKRNEERKAAFLASVAKQGA